MSPGRVCEPRSSSRKISSMHIAQTRLSIATAPREIKEITAEVARWTERQRISVGLLTLYIPHTSAPLLIQENASPDVRRDLDAFLPRIVPGNVAPYRHHDEGPDDMPAHIKSALAQTQLSSPVTDGRFAARHLAGVPIPCVSRADPPGSRIRRAADFSEPPLRYVVVWNVAKETARRTLSHFVGEVVIGTASRLRWDQEFESPFLQRRESRANLRRAGMPTSDVEELLAERGLDVSYETVRLWVLKFGPVLARRLALGF